MHPDNQRYEILKYADVKKLSIDTWIEETVSGSKKVEQRKLGPYLNKMQSAYLLIVSELSRLGRNLMEVMSILHTCMEKEIKVFTVKEKYELGNNINS
ncbi:DNA invertase Pin-like site-specific DNA recombinase [Catalinimonas alkaloidigena]|uniref:recombinase family protein n=1 Tax=Catalinimonas alkaloidigena TaxID=1075417 RepID=UPI0024052CE2|nr:recombinase family protein [Catalinimonas alkaloidigena]MDF9799217.1 DNA invertase Pin-like site-specific DNA recombinase [Catalinimonas alkaloidigena]